MRLKPGYKTSEFWFTLVSFIFSGLYLTGLITENDQKEELITIVSHAVESCILIGGQLVILYKYVNGRSKIKEKFEEKEKDDEQRPPVNKSRTNKTRSKQSNSKHKVQPRSSKKNSNR